MASRFFLKSALNKLNVNDETPLEQIIVDSTTAASKAIENSGDKIDTRQVEEALKNALMNEVQKEIKDNATLNAIHDAVMSDKPLEEKILGASQKLLSEKQSKVVGGIMDQLRYVKELEAQQKAEFEAEQRAQADRQKQAAAELFESEMATRSRSASQSESAAALFGQATCAADSSGKCGAARIACGQRVTAQSHARAGHTGQRAYGRIRAERQVRTRRIQNHFASVGNGTATR
jgi:hypothetical protein